MKLRSLIVATFVLLVLAGTLYWSGHRKGSEETVKASADAPPAILKLDQSSITKVEMKNKDAEPIVLAKGDSGSWQIQEPKPFNADQSSVLDMLSSLSSLTSERVVENKNSDLARFGLDNPTLEVDVTAKDNKTHQLLLGDETPTGGAVYAMVAGDPRIFTMATYNKTSIDKSVNDLRDKRLITENADKINQLQLIRKNQEIEFGRTKDGWQILKPKPLRADSVQVGELLGKLADARMDLSAPQQGSKEIAAAAAHAAPVATAKVTDQSGTQELQVYKDKDTYYAKSSVVGGTYKVDSSLGQAVDKSLEDFRNKKVFDFGYNEPTKIEIHNGSKAYFLIRSGEDWWSNGKKMDADGVEMLLSDLRDLEASKFVDSGFGQPSMELVVSSNDGKRVEQVSISRSGAGFIAKRESDPTLYYLESGSVNGIQKAADDLKPAVKAPK
ncbi:MAG TPA: DUF4340 domain-containing protein [Candidatus Aquilonibacter sp.]|nr:DUF4340 domain-containing protein [Candidatus Aquilonibacter sp.]